MPGPIQPEHDYMSECIKILDALANIDVSQLSPRQREVFLLLAQGLPPKEVAQKLYIKHSTVCVHISDGKFNTNADTTSALTIAVAVSIIALAMQQTQGHNPPKTAFE